VIRKRYGSDKDVNTARVVAGEVLVGATKCLEEGKFSECLDLRGDQHPGDGTHAPRADPLA
jgi:hypothetical protein